MTNKESAMNFEQRAAEDMADFCYTKLSSGQAEVWRCKNPENTFFAFDICITRFGIAAFGDFGSLVFNVGSSYGIPFLAGNDVDYYIHSKLEEHCKVKEFDREYFDEMRCEAVCNRIASMNEDAGIDDGDEGYIKPPDRGEENWDDYVLTLKKFCIDKAVEVGCGDDREWHDTLWGMYEFLDCGADDARDAHDLFQDNEELLNISDTWECNFEKPYSNLIQRLYMLRHAAKRILEIKFPEPGSAVGEYGSMGEPV